MFLLSRLAVPSQHHGTAVSSTDEAIKWDQNTLERVLTFSLVLLLGLLGAILKVDATGRVSARIQCSLVSPSLRQFEEYRTLV
jgi:hypothetical protein